MLIEQRLGKILLRLVFVCLRQRRNYSQFFVKRFRRFGTGVELLLSGLGNQAEIVQKVFYFLVLVGMLTTDLTGVYENEIITLLRYNALTIPLGV